jgi:cytochrome c-type biogenesis protein CcmH/NrfG
MHALHPFASPVISGGNEVKTVRAIAVIALIGMAIGLGVPSVEAAKDVSALVTRAKKLKKQKKLTQAIKVLKTAIEESPKDVNAHSTLGWIYLAKGQKEEAAAEFQTVVQLAPASSAGKDAQQALVKMGSAAGAGDEASEDEEEPRPRGNRILQAVWRGFCGLLFCGFFLRRAILGFRRR